MVPDGRYDYSVAPSDAFDESGFGPSSGVVVVDGMNVTIQVRGPYMMSCGPLVATTTTTSSTAVENISTSASNTSVTYSPLKIVSVTLVNSSIGSDLIFNVTFTNAGDSPISYLRYDGRATPISASVGDFQPQSPPPLQPYQISTDCTMIGSFVILNPGQTVSAYSTYCTGQANYKIVGAGTFNAIISLTWAEEVNQNNPHIMTATVSQNFIVG